MWAHADALSCGEQSLDRDVLVKILPTNPDAVADRAIWRELLG